jgi:hypothetical protein
VLVSPVIVTAPAESAPALSRLSSDKKHVRKKQQKTKQPRRFDAESNGKISV